MTSRLDSVAAKIGARMIRLRQRWVCMFACVVPAAGALG
jgi:hypothetical protein